MASITQDYEEVLADFKELLKKNGMKNTKQREVVIETLFNSNRHFTPEELYLLIKEKYPTLNVGIATVYRTLNLLESSDMITSITFGTQGKKYEMGAKEHHDHMICSECGKIIEFVSEEIEELQQKIAKSHGFLLTEHIMQLHGICKECQEKN
jgi:Fur family ferric uptake transcriptional regulator